MKKTAIILVILALVAVLGLNSLFTVREDQYACTVRFSQIIDTTADAGLHSSSPSWIPSAISPRPPSSTTFPRPRF